MLRFLIGTGAILMATGFGAAGWQYWKHLPAAKPSSAVMEASPVGEMEAYSPARPTDVQAQSLISPTGGAIPHGDALAYLAQDRFVPARTVEVTLQANLADLLADGEKLPEVAYLQVLADIRAPRLAEDLCEVVTQSFAAACAVNAARVLEGSVDPAAGTARFRVELVYRLDSAEETPDLATHMLRESGALLTLESGTVGTETARDALAAALATATEACAADGVEKLCRPMRLAVNWAPGAPVEASVAVAWLSPLPEGMFTAPPLSPVSGK